MNTFSGTNQDRGGEGRRFLAQFVHETGHCDVRYDVLVPVGNVPGIHWPGGTKHLAPRPTGGLQGFDWTAG